MPIPGPVRLAGVTRLKWDLVIGDIAEQFVQEFYPKDANSERCSPDTLVVFSRRVGAGSTRRAIRVPPAVVAVRLRLRRGHGRRKHSCSAGARRRGRTDAHASRVGPLPGGATSAGFG